MKIVQSLICFCLRQYIGDPAEKVFQFVVARFNDKSQALPKAVEAANKQTWQALGVALAGKGLLDQFKYYVLNDATENAIRAQLEPFLRACAIEFNQHHEDVRKECLAELKLLRQNDALKGHLPKGLFGKNSLEKEDEQELPKRYDRQTMGDIGTAASPFARGSPTHA